MCIMATNNHHLVTSPQHPRLVFMADVIQLTINGEPRQIMSGQTIADLLAEMGLKPQQVAVEVNLDLVPRESHADHQLADGDAVEVVTLVGGG